MPSGNDGTSFYSILKYFTDQEVKPLYSVVENPALKTPRVSVSLLYSRKPAEDVQDFNREAEKHAQQAWSRVGRSVRVVRSASHRHTYFRSVMTASSPVTPFTAIPRRLYLSSMESTPPIS